MLKAYVRRILIGALVLLANSCGSINQLGVGEATPGLTHADFERAARFYPDAVRGLVLNAAPVPNWIGETDQFWYRRDLSGGFRFETVNAATGEAAPSFNHEEIARMLSLELGKTISAQKLPFTSFRYSDGLKRIVFAAGEKTFECSRDASFCNMRSETPPDPAAALSPDGAHAVFARDHNLWVRETSGGRERSLTTDGTAEFPYQYTAFRTTYIEERRGTEPPTYPGATWSPDGRYILAVRTDYRGVKSAPYVVEYLPPDSPRPIAHQIAMPTAADAPKVPYTLSLIDRKSGRVVEVDGGAFGFNDYAPYWAIVGEPGWDMENGELHLVTSTRDSRALGLVAVDLETGNVRTVLEERGDQFLNLNPFDYHVPNVRLLASRGEILWWSERSGWGHLYRYDARTGALKNAVTKGDWAVFDIVRIDEAAGVVYFTGGGKEQGRNPYYRHLYRVNLDGSGLKLR